MPPDIPTGRLPPVVTCRRALRLFPGLVGLAVLPLPAVPAGAEPPVDGESFSLAAGESRSWTVDLAAGEAFRLRALPHGVDVELRLFAPAADRGGPEAGLELASAQGMIDLDEPEELEVVADRPGPHRIELHARGGKGRCRLAVSAPRPATALDRRRAEAAAATGRLFGTLREIAARQELNVVPTAEDQRRLAWRDAEMDRLLLAWQELDDAGREATLFYARGLTALDDRQWERAGDDLLCAARLAQEAGSEALAADAFNDAGRAERKRAFPEQARQLFEQALGLYREQGRRVSQAVALSNLGNAFKDLGDPRAAVARLRESLALAREAGAEETALNTQVNLCNALQSLHDREEALATCQAALAEARRQGDDELEGAALNNLGTLHESLGEWDQALVLYKLALQQAKDLGNQDWEGRTLINLGFLYQRSWRDADPARDPLKEAEVSYGAALEIMRRLPNRQMEARALSQLALVEVQRGRGPQALQLARQALPLANDPEEQPIARFALGQALRLTGDLPGARQELDRARELHRGRGDLNLEAAATFALAHVERALDNLPAAVAQADAALALIESLRARVVSPDLRASFLASKQDYYAFKIDTLMRLHERDPLAGYADAALQASDRARARSLFEVLSEAQADLRRGVAPALLERERRASEDLNVGEWYRRYSLRTTDALAPEVSLKLASAQAESQKVEEELLLASPLYATLAQPRSTPLAEIQRDILDPDTLLLEYFLGGGSVRKLRRNWQRFATAE